MVRAVVMYAVCAVVAGALGCRSDAAQSGGQVASVASPAAATATPGGEFRYTLIDNVPMVGWYAADGKQVILLRVDSRWVCDLSSGQLHCGARQAASTICSTCLLSPCPCADARCLPMCSANAAVVPGVHDPAAAVP